MEMNVSKTAENLNSVGMLKEHIAELPIKNLDSEWVREQKVDLESLMVDSHPGFRINALPPRSIR